MSHRLRNIAKQIGWWIPIYMLAGLGLGWFFDLPANHWKSLAYWGSGMVAFGFARLYLARVDERPEGIKHLQWSALAETYAKALNVTAREVQVCEGFEGSFMARAEHDRILVRLEESSRCSDDQMEFVIAHEAAHYVPAEVSLTTHAFRLFVGVSTTLAVVCSPWWSLPILGVGMVAVLASWATYKSRQLEYRTDALAVAITSVRLALTLYQPHKEVHKLHWLRKGPSYNSRRAAILSRASLDELRID